MTLIHKWFEDGEWCFHFVTGADFEWSDKWAREEGLTKTPEPIRFECPTPEFKVFHTWTNETTKEAWALVEYIED